MIIFETSLITRGTTQIAFKKRHLVKLQQALRFYAAAAGEFYLPTGVLLSGSEATNFITLYSGFHQTPPLWSKEDKPSSSMPLGVLNW